MRRGMVLAIVLVVGLLGSSTGADDVLAAPTPKTTVKLTCDRGTGASQVSVQLRPSLFDSTVLGTASLSCGPDSTSGARSETAVVQTSQPAGWANVTTFTWTTSLGSGGCVGGGALPLKQTCEDTNAVGATLVVR
jgi:hypothetical protein